MPYKQKFKNFSIVANSYLGKITNKELLPVWLLLLLCIVVDFITRFNTHEIEQYTEWKKTSIAAESFQLLSDKHYDDIVKKLKLFSGPEKPRSTNSAQQGMSEAEQLAQQGDLNELYAKNFRYRLMGIIEQNYRFAIILQENLLTKKKEVIKVKELESLLIYNIKKILDDKVTIVGNDKEINLFLYKTNNQSE